MPNTIGYVDITAGLPRQKTLVCVTDQRRCDRIIEAGRRLADLTDSELAIINVVRPDRPQDPDSIEYLFSVAKENGAEMTLVYSPDIAKSIINCVKSSRTAYMLTGIPRGGDSVTTKIWRKFTHITFFVVEENGELRKITQPAKAAMRLIEAKAAI